MPQRQTMPKQATRLMGGPQPKTKKSTFDLCRQLTPGLGLNMGMESSGSGPTPPPPDYGAYSDGYADGYS